MSRPLVRSELVGAELVWLLSVTYAGRVFRWSSRPVNLTNSDGEVLPFDGGLPPVDYDDAAQVLATDPADLSIPFSVVFPVDVAVLVQRGHDLATGSAEVSVIIDNGTATYEDRRVVLVGDVTQPTYGAIYEPVTFSVEDPPWLDRALIPSTTQRVNSTTWSGAPMDSHGLYYPLVFGTPGVFTWASGTATVTSGSPALIVDVTGSNVNTLLIAGHWVKAGSVRVYDGDGTGVSGTVQNTTDGLGQPVAIVDVSGLGGTVDLTTSDWFIGWNNGGAMYNDRQDGAREGAGEIAEWALRASTVRYDRGLWASARRSLDGFILAGYIDEPVSPWEWLADNVLPLLPVSVRSGPTGSFPVVYKYDARSADSIESVTAGAGFVRVGPVEYVTGAGDRANEMRIDYAKRARKNTAFRAATVGPFPSDDPDVFENYYAGVSARRYGVRSSTIDTDIVYDTPTAIRIARWKVRASSLSSRSVTYSASFEYGWLSVGDVIDLTDDELALDAQIVQLVSIKWGASGLDLTFYLLDDPPRDTHTTG